MVSIFRFYARDEMEKGINMKLWNVPWTLLKSSMRHRCFLKEVSQAMCRILHFPAHLGIANIVLMFHQKKKLGKVGISFISRKGWACIIFVVKVYLPRRDVVSIQGS